MEIIEKLNWRYATKKFDSSFKLSEKQLEDLQTIVQLSPASYGLQPYKILMIENPEIREKLKGASWGQTQVTDASPLFVFLRKTNVDESEVNSFMENMVETRGVTREMLAEYEGMIKHTVNSLNEQQMGVWVEKQIYIALGNLMTAAAIEGIDTCPMEGFSKEQYNEILGLTDYTTVVVCTIGKRADDDGYQHYKKVRKPKTELFEVI